MEDERTDTDLVEADDVGVREQLERGDLAAYLLVRALRQHPGALQDLHGKLPAAAAVPRLLHLPEVPSPSVRPSSYAPSSPRAPSLTMSGWLGDGLLDHLISGTQYRGILFSAGRVGEEGDWERRPDRIYTGLLQPSCPLLSFIRFFISLSRTTTNFIL